MGGGEGEGGVFYGRARVGGVNGLCVNLLSCNFILERKLFGLV